TFQCLTDSIKFNPIEFLENFIPSLEKKESSYYEIWNSIRIEKQKKQEEFSSQIAFSDFKAIEKIVETYPKNAQIQYGNSSIIRYAQLFDHEASLEVFCNRGTSGID